MKYEVIEFLDGDKVSVLAEGFDSMQEATEWVDENIPLSSQLRVHICQEGIWPRTDPTKEIVGNLHELANLLGGDGEVYIGDPSTGEWDLIQGNDPGDEITNCPECGAILQSNGCPGCGQIDPREEEVDDYDYFRDDLNYDAARERGRI